MVVALSFQQTQILIEHTGNLYRNGKNEDILLGIVFMTSKILGNVYFINQNSHAKYNGYVSNGRDATPWV